MNPLLFIGATSSRRGTGSAPPGISVTNITVTPASSKRIVSFTTNIASKDQLPVASGVDIVGSIFSGETVSAAYTYTHINNAPEGSTEITWYTATNEAFTTGVTEVGTGETHDLISGYVGKYFRCKVVVITSGGTEGVEVFSPVYLVGSSLIEKRILVSFGSATKPFSDTNWNLAHTNDPAATYELNNLVNEDGVTITGLNIDVDLAMSDQNLGSANAGTGAASEFPANAAKEYWYPTAGTRGFLIEIPVGGLGVTLGKIKILSNTTTAGTHTARLQVNGVEQVLSNVQGNTIDGTKVATFENVDLSGNVTIRSIDDTGISPINAMIIYYYEEA